MIGNYDSRNQSGRGAKSGEAKIMNIKDRIYLAKLNAEMTPGNPTKVILGLNERKKLEAAEEIAPFGLAVIASEENNYMEIV